MWRKRCLADATAAGVRKVRGRNPVSLAAARAGTNDRKTHWLARGERGLFSGRGLSGPGFGPGLCLPAGPGSALIRSTVHVRTTFGCCPLSIGSSPSHHIAHGARGPDPDRASPRLGPLSAHGPQRAAPEKSATVTQAGRCGQDARCFRRNRVAGGSGDLENRRRGCRVIPRRDHGRKRNVTPVVT